ncbi:solute carrier family 22 member 16-like, partial [Hyposmocoma kahamanoa]|uniref:solute carrier family 22 member 16-like n=1 Tax=Hyposmocoma kahamanoa TaxID=1477025 RepID=UPI000E6D8F40
NNNEKKPWLVVEVFRHKPILLRCLVSPVLWITMTFVYYGLSINAVNMAGDQYLNYALASAVEIPGYWSALLVMRRVGRRPVLTSGYWICAACQAAYIFLPDGQFSLSLIVFLLGKLSIAMVATTLYVYTAELYPTRYRHSLFAFSSMMGRIGSILAPLTPALGASVWEQLPFTLFGGMALLSGALVLVAPETLGAKLPDTMEEAARLGKN